MGMIWFNVQIAVHPARIQKFPDHAPIICQSKTIMLTMVIWFIRFAAAQQSLRSVKYDDCCERV